MKLVMTLLVRDEEDVLEANLLYHYAQGVDFVIATDNRSVDSTSDILKQFEHQGRLRYLFEGDDDYAQGRWVTRMARLAATEHGADWVINNDADEFWWPKQGDLKDALAAVPPSVGVVRARRVNFVPRPGGAAPVSGMNLREVRSRNAKGNPLPPKVCHRGDPDVVVAQGNHAVEMAPAAVWEGEPIVILHYPLRSYRQFANKIALGGQAYERNQELPPHVGSTWRRLFELHRAGELPAYWAAQEVGDAAAEAGIAGGQLIRDRRLGRFLARHGIGQEATRA